MLRPQLMGLFLTLIGSGCSTFTPSTLLYWETLQVPAEEPDLDQLHQSKFERQAKQLSPGDLNAGYQVQLVLVVRHTEDDGLLPPDHLHVTY